jgi:long-chain acyl-CoA synthetase
MLLENDPLMIQAVLLGDRRPFMAALVVADRKAIAAQLKKDETALTDGEVEGAVQSRIDQINAKLEDVERIRRIVVMKSEFPVTVRSITAFQKVKVERTMVEKLYEKEIRDIYSPVVEGAGT